MGWDVTTQSSAHSFIHPNKDQKQLAQLGDTSGLDQCPPLLLLPHFGQAFYSILTALLQRKLRLLLPMSSVHSHLSPALAATPTSTSNRQTSCATCHSSSCGICTEPLNPPSEPHRDTADPALEQPPWYPALLPHWAGVNVKVRNKDFIYLKGDLQQVEKGKLDRKRYFPPNLYGTWNFFLAYQVLSA